MANSKTNTFLFTFLLIILSTTFLNSHANAVRTYNVMRFGAKPNGATDSTKGFLGAWAAACGDASPSVIYVPKGRFVVGPLVFKGCNSSDIALRIDGTLVGLTDYRVFQGYDKWISFEFVSGVTIVGGKLDARGPAFWACKLAQGGGCPAGVTTLSFTNSNNIKVTGLLSLNSQMFHIAINGCQNVQIQGTRVIAKGDSPNTDGIHVQYSSEVVIRNTKIGTGDDCIAVGPGAKNLLMERIRCGPGHGISIGSLGRDVEEPGVQNVTVKKSVFIGTQNGLRIKTWAKPSNGFVQRIQYLDIIMRNVQNPIVIDQNYCPSNIDCPTQVSGIKISDVVYQGIRGTSATPVAIKFDCSPKNPCTGIKLRDVNLKSANQVEAARSSCANAKGMAFGLVLPKSCLL
ncbi:Glycoside hydrolase [Parasponia andersonii]|uniref:Glycoside hydrolase n=1 Tax=Parasponia andersonii TaxID=3476 RepID=A0A2P5DR22_PARAD|nr:Glycoside hydrolase [Parasponia andersonii]